MFVIGLIIFIIPGIILVLKYCMGGLIVLDQGENPWNALKKSNLLTQGNNSPLLLLVILGFIIDAESRMSNHFIRMMYENGLTTISVLATCSEMLLRYFFLVPLFCVAVVCAYNILKKSQGSETVEMR
jgi:hypothetical protein